MKIAIMPNLTRDTAREVTDNCCRELEKLNIEYVFSSALREELKEYPAKAFCEDADFVDSADYVISIGGDGSMLRAAKIAAQKNKKILGINAGRLAYLCSLDANEMHLLSALKKENFSLQSRMMLKAELFSENRKISENFCINDIVFCRVADIGLIDLSVCANGKNIGNYLADGLILATPTGSTGYSLSAGGPIIEPTLDAIVLSPVCPHSLAVRPYVFSASTVFEISCRLRAGDVSVGFSCDGEKTVLLDESSVVKVTKAEASAQFISIKSDNFIDVLNKKLEIKKM